MYTKVLYIKTEDLNNNPNKLIDLLENNSSIRDAQDMVVQKYEQYTYFIFVFNKPVHNVDDKQYKDSLLKSVKNTENEVSNVSDRQNYIGEKLEELEYMLNRSSGHAFDNDMFGWRAQRLYN